MNFNFGKKVPDDTELVKAEQMKKNVADSVFGCRNSAVLKTAATAIAAIAYFALPAYQTTVFVATVSYCALTTLLTYLREQHYINLVLFGVEKNIELQKIKTGRNPAE